MNNQINSNTDELRKQILDFSKHIAGQSKITAVAQINNYTSTLSNDRAIYEVMLIVEDFAPKLMSYIKTVGNKTIFFYAIDSWIFERDVEKGFIGEAMASKLVFPYHVIVGKSYLYKNEVKLKKRLSLELLENLVFGFPELASRMQILPQYFLYEVLSNRVRVFPLLVYDWGELKNYLKENEENALLGYKEALRQLEKENKISLKDGYIMIEQELEKETKDPKTRILNLAKNAPRTLFSSLFGVLPQLINSISYNTEEFKRTQRISWLRQIDPCYNLVDPQKYVLFPTGDTLVSLADKMDIKIFVEKMIPKEQSEKIDIEHLGGMLNDVYLIKATGNSNEHKVLAKRFKDWSGFKWFPLTLWSFGARSFSVSGRARLARECAISDLLRSKGFNVPKILYVSNPERLIFMEYVEGENLTQVVKRIASAEAEETRNEISLISKVGQLFARIHANSIALGDTKPDNAIIKSNGELFLIDFEQATQGGDEAWDIAVFLYYSGHYLQPLYSKAKAEAITQAFIDGYLKEGGNVKNIHNAGSSKYTRVFSIFTLPSIMFSIANICKNAQKCERSEKSH